MLTKLCCLGAKPAKPRIRQVLVFRARKESKEENGDDVIYGLRGTGPVQDQKTRRMGDMRCSGRGADEAVDPLFRLGGSRACRNGYLKSTSMHTEYVLLVSSTGCVLGCVPGIVQVMSDKVQRQSWWQPDWPQDRHPSKIRDPGI